MVATDAVVLGAGGMGREAAAWIQAANADGGRLRLLGFLDSDPRFTGAEIAGLPVLGGLDWLDGRSGTAVVPAIGATRSRKEAVSEVRRRGLDVAGVVHPNATIGPRVELGAGTIVAPRVVITVDVRVGECAILNFGCVIGHDGRLGDFVTVGPGAAIAGGVTLGDGTDIGIGASIIQGLHVGDWTVVGAGAAVVRDLPPGVTAVGVPARPLGSPPPQRVDS